MIPIQQTYNYLLYLRNKQLFSAQIPLFEGGNNSQNIMYNKIIKNKWKLIIMILITLTHLVRKTGNFP